MHYEEFKMLVLKQRVPNGLRAGQVAFNELSKVRSDLCDKLFNQRHCDPFNNDNNLPAFWQFLKDEWYE